MTESELLYEYLGVQLQKGGREKPVREVLSGYIKYRKQLNELRVKLREAEASSARGESAELDVEELIAEVTEQLAAEGIT
jgi:hypothetical protein